MSSENSALSRSTLHVHLHRSQCDSHDETQCLYQIASENVSKFLVNQNPKFYPDQFRCLVNQNPKTVNPSMQMNFQCEMNLVILISLYKKRRGFCFLFLFAKQASYHVRSERVRLAVLDLLTTNRIFSFAWPDSDYDVIFAIISETPIVVIVV